MADVEITMHGMDELMEDLQRLIKKYPDKAGDLLKKNAKDFRKKYIKQVKSTARHKSGKSKSLVKAKNMKIYPVQGIGIRQSIDIGSISPHFHLFERGHNLIVPWMPSVSGYVEGRHVMEQSIADYEKLLPEIAEKMRDELLKEGNLL
jgi:hypothetical protein